MVHIRVCGVHPCVGMGSHTHMEARGGREVSCSVTLHPILTEPGAKLAGNPKDCPVSPAPPARRSQERVCGHPQLLHGAGTEAQTPMLARPELVVTDDKPTSTWKDVHLHSH